MACVGLPGVGSYTAAGRRTISDPPGKETFDSAFLSELEGLVTGSEIQVSEVASEGDSARGYLETLAAFLAPIAPGGAPLSEAAFLDLPESVLTERGNGLIEACRRSPRREAAQATESFVIFFQTLVPTLGREAAREVKSTFFRLVPTLVQLAWEDEVEAAEGGSESKEVLALVETILLEIASVRLAPVESGQLFRNLDQLATLIAAGEWALARDVIATPLLGILRKNRGKRSLYRLMEGEMTLQSYLKDRLGHETPHIRVPDDLKDLAEFGPLRVFEEENVEGRLQVFLQVQLPDIPILSDVVVHLLGDSGDDYRLRLDGLGSIPLDVRAGLYEIALFYEPEGTRD